MPGFAKVDLAHPLWSLLMVAGSCVYLSGRCRTLQGVTGDSQDEATLWGAVLHGDPESFGLIFDLHKDRVFRHAVRWQGASPESDDAVALAFMELWRRRTDVRLVGGSVLLDRQPGPEPWELCDGRHRRLNRMPELGWLRHRALEPSGPIDLALTGKNWRPREESIRKGLRDIE